MRVKSQLRIPTALYMSPRSLPSVPPLLAGPAAIVKLSNGLSRPTFTESWWNICGSWLAIFPAPPFPFTSHGVSALQANVILLLNVLSELLSAASRCTKMLLVSNNDWHDPKQLTVAPTDVGPYHKL